MGRPSFSKHRGLLPWSAVLLLVVAPPALHAQVSGTLRGVVRSAATGEPIVGATVQIIGTNVATQTDDEGRYRLQSVPIGVTVIRQNPGLLGYSQHTSLAQHVSIFNRARRIVLWCDSQLN